VYKRQTPQDGFTGDTEGSPGRPVEGGGTIGGDFFEAPDPPAYHIPLESECDIVVDGSDFSIVYENSLSHISNIPAGDWIASGMGSPDWTQAELDTLAASSGGNPIGALKNEINLVAQAVNRAIVNKTYYPLTVSGWTYEGYADELGPIKVGIKGNGGSFNPQEGPPNASPESRISNNKIDMWDSAHNNPKKEGGSKIAYADAIPGAPEPVATHGLHITYVGLDTGAQMRYQVHGPEDSRIYDPIQPYSAIASATRKNAPSRHVEIFNLKLRPNNHDDVQYFFMLGHIQGHFYMEGCEFMPHYLDADFSDEWSFSGPSPILYTDVKSCIRLNHEVVGTTILKGNGTSRNFPATAQLFGYTGATDLVTAQEHQYYIKDGLSLIHI
jgi:hypothetical protein